MVRIKNYMKRSLVINLENKKKLMILFLGVANFVVACGKKEEQQSFLT